MPAPSRRITIAVPLANPICVRIFAGGDGSRLEGTRQVGFAAAAACLAPPLAPQIGRWRAHGGSMLNQAQVEAHLSPRGARGEPNEIQSARRSYRW